MATTSPRRFKKIVYTFLESPPSVEYSYIVKQGNESSLVALEAKCKAAVEDTLERVTFGLEDLPETVVDVLCELGGNDVADLPVVHRKFGGRLKAPADMDALVAEEGAGVIAHWTIHELFV